MRKHPLHPQLVGDTFLIGYFGTSAVLLSKNAHYRWLILVPDTEKTGLHRLDQQSQTAVMLQASTLANFIEESMTVDRVNIAAIGNVVPQLHIHVVGRSSTDPSWPAPVWGHEAFVEYASEEPQRIQQALAAYCAASNVEFNTQD